MTEATPPIDDDDAALAELVAKALTAVRHVHAQLMAATDTDEINSLGRTYQRVSRSLRQTLALKAKLKRDAAQEAATAPATKPADRLDFTSFSIDVRLETIQDAVSRVIDATTADEPERREQLYERLDREMDDWELDDLWLCEHPNDQVARACEALDLPADLARTWRRLPKNCGPTE